MRFASRHIGLFIFLLSISFSLTAQHTERADSLRADSLLNEMTDINKKVKIYTSKDTVTRPAIYRLIDSVLAQIDRSKKIMMTREPSGILKAPQDNWVPFDREVTFNDTIIFDPVFLPVVFEGNILPSDLDLTRRNDTFPLYPVHHYYLIDPDSTFAPALKEVNRIEAVRRAYLVENPDKVKLNFVTMSKLPRVESRVVDKPNPLKELLTPEDPIEVSAPEVEKTRIKPVYWKKEGDHSLTFSQNNYSDNWAGGSDNTFNIKNFHRVILRYKKNKVSFVNTFEWRLDLQKNEGDTMRSMAVTSDYLRVNSSLGLDAFIRNWTYTFDVTASTPIFNMYPVNSKTMKQAFLSPLKVNTGIGMKYGLTKKAKSFKGNRLSMSVSILPLAIDYTLVNNDEIDASKYIDKEKVKKGDKSQTKLGSTINIESFKYYFTKNIYIDSRLTFFTSYEYAKIESFNRLRFDLNRYLTTEISGNFRLDDSVDPTKKGKWDYWQYNYSLSFGLAYKW